MYNSHLSKSKPWFSGQSLQTIIEHKVWPISNDLGYSNTKKRAYQKILLFQVIGTTMIKNEPTCHCLEHRLFLNYLIISPHESQTYRQTDGQTDRKRLLRAHRA